MLFLSHTHGNLNILNEKYSYVCEKNIFCVRRKGLISKKFIIGFGCILNRQIIYYFHMFPRKVFYILQQHFFFNVNVF